MNDSFHLPLSFFPFVVFVMCNRHPVWYHMTLSCKVICTDVPSFSPLSGGYLISSGTYISTIPTVCDLVCHRPIKLTELDPFLLGSSPIRLGRLAWSSDHIHESGLTCWAVTRLKSWWAQQWPECLRPIGYQILSHSLLIIFKFLRPPQSIILLSL